MKQMLQWIVGGALAAMLAGCATGQPGIQDAPTPPGLRVTDTAGKDHYFTVELATTDHEIERGLMERTHLPEDSGMLFLFNPPEVWQFWMKDTYISLDMLFIDARGRVIKIFPRAKPDDWTAVSSDKPVRAVLEINGGRTRALGITVGSHVELPAYPPKK